MRRDEPGSVLSRNDLHTWTAAEQLRALRARQITSTELTEHYLDRIDRLDAGLGCFVTVTAELARTEAARADERLARGDRGALLGLPIGIKDLHATAGVRTLLGSAAFEGNVPTQDSWTVGRLRRAGAVLVGKTSASEFGASCFTHDPLTGAPAVTPYDVGRYASGSSAGAAAAVAAGLLPLAHASDGAGSVRTPASTCHLVGVKPSRGLVSSAPASSFLGFGTEGPIARTVNDAALLLDVMAQPWPGDLYGWRPSGSLADAAQRPPDAPLRVAMWTASGHPGDAPHPDSLRAVGRAAALLRELGHQVVEIEIPATYDAQVTDALVGLFASSLDALVGTAVPVERRRLLSPYTRWLLQRAEQMTARDVVLGQAVIARYASAFLLALEDVDVALTPTTHGPPVPVGTFDDDTAERMLRWSCHTPWVNFTGQPAVSLPSLLDREGLPHGVQLVGRPKHDAALLALAGQLERHGLWTRTPPPAWSA